MSAPLATILIPTYNRPRHLKRLLDYLESNFDLEQIKLLVLDGSTANTAANREACLNHEAEYHDYGPDTPLLTRWLDGIKLTQTEWVSFLADDDILQPEGYGAALDFLQNHPDYAAAHGSYIWFKEVEDEKTLIYPGYQTFSIEDDLALKRLFAFLTNYYPITYAVYRTPILKTAYEQTISRLNSDSFHFTELLSGCLPVVLGKIKKIDCSYYGRNLGPSSPRPALKYSQLLFSENFYPAYAQIKTSLKAFITDSVNASVLDEAIDLCFGAYYGKLLNQRLLSRYFQHLVG